MYNSAYGHPCRKYYFNHHVNGLRATNKTTTATTQLQQLHGSFVQQGSLQQERCCGMWDLSSLYACTTKVRQLCSGCSTSLKRKISRVHAQPETLNPPNSREFTWPPQHEHTSAGMSPRRRPCTRLLLATLNSSVVSNGFQCFHRVRVFSVVCAFGALMSDMV